MALVVLELPGKTTYKFTNTTGGTVPDYNVQASPEVAFSNNRGMLSASDGTRRYIVKPNINDFIVGAYAYWGKQFVMKNGDLRAIGGGNYQKFVVDGGNATTITLSYDIQIGDFLMRDGSLLPKETELTAGQKADVAAIVFWTPSETATTGRTTPASLSDDKIMAADYPSCKHGLAVAIKDMGYMYWQETEGSVADFQNSTDFTHSLKSQFKSIATSNWGATDLINYILGYQNTQVLKAYNAYCKANGNEEYVMLPVDSLSGFAANYPAPAGSTGWFIPSGKEMFMLCRGDYDNICYANGYPTTAKIVDTSISAVGGDKIIFTEDDNAYHVSTEQTTYMSYIISFYNNGSGATMGSRGKGEDCVRAVCAF